jgi:CRISPR/Cas system-associated endonuclease/helicase Cas3
LFVPPFFRHANGGAKEREKEGEKNEKVKVFFYAHSVTDADRENILSLEKSYFQLRQNSSKKQKTMYDFFFLKKSDFPD